MSRPVPKADGDAHEVAAFWYARMTSDVRTPADEAAFDAWLAQSHQHGEAYAEACAIAGRFDAIAGHPDVSALKVEAQLLEERARRPLLARVGAAWAATMLAAAAAALFYFNSAPLERGGWVTARGETREISLSDGTEIVLGSDARLEMRFRSDRRDLRLYRGQAFFDVAHDADRPFRVSTDERTITALGTAFDVRSYLNETTVTLVRGRVAVARDGEGQEAVLAPGQQFRAVFGVASVRDVNAAAQTSWRRGVLDFDGVTLAEAITEFNRGARHSIILTDPRLANLRVSGVFRADDPLGFVAALTPVYPLTPVRQSSGDVMLNYKD